MSRPWVELLARRPGAELDAARRVLRPLLARLGWMVCWEEWRLGDPLLPRELAKAMGRRRPGAEPVDLALFVDRRLVWRHGEPWDEALVERFRAAATGFRPPAREPLGRRLRLSLLPALGVALLPKCPLCWAAYTGAFASSGLGIAPERLAAVRWALVAALAVALAGILWRSVRLRRPGPAVAATLAVAAVLAGRLALDSTAVTALGLVLLAATAVASSWPRRRGVSRSAALM
jgi:hypothetical protein